MLYMRAKPIATRARLCSCLFQLHGPKTTENADATDSNCTSETYCVLCVCECV